MKSAKGAGVPFVQMKEPPAQPTPSPLPAGSNSGGGSAGGGSAGGAGGSAGSGAGGAAGGAAASGGGAVKIPKGCEYLSNQETVEASKSDFDRIRKKSTLGPGQPGTHTFPGDSKASDAIIHEVEVDGRKVKVITPKNKPKGKHIPTAQQVADGLGTVPGKQLDSIKQVVISPNQNPDDAYWATTYNMPNFSSAATGGSGKVTFYPQTTAWSQEFIDSTTIHEGGHTYSQALWKDPKKKKAWEALIKKDKNAPSKYAKSSTGEDFSESLVMYSLSKGTKCEPTAKALYPERYKALDTLLK